MKKIINLLSVLSVLFLVACQVSVSKFKVIFYNEDVVSYSIEVEDTSSINFNELYTVSKVGHDFIGWYYDIDLTDAYNPNDILYSNMHFYAKFNIKTLKVSFLDTLNNKSFLFDVSYGTSIEFLKLTHEMYTLTNWETESKEIYDFSLPVTNSFSLNSVWVINPEKHTISFETNGGNQISSVYLNDQSLFSNPPVAIRDEYLFDGWYTDSSLSNLFDKSLPVINDMTLYAKWKEKFDTTDITYKINGDILEFDGVEGALMYHVYIGSHTNTPILSYLPSINLSSYKTLLEHKTNVEIYAEFDFGQNQKLFNVILQYLSNNIVYQTGFEESEFIASTSYNNQSIKYTGPQDMQWSYLSGSPSTTGPIAGAKSFQLRNYAAPTSRYIESVFTLSNVSKMTFKARSEHHDLIIKYYVDNNLNEQTFSINLTDTATLYTVNFNEIGAFRVRFEMVQGTATIGQQVRIDDITFYTDGTGATLIEHEEVVIDDYPETDESKLITLKERFQSDRLNLGQPTFSNALSETGLLNYYASLNGLTDNAFKKELEKITKNSHERLISYGDARFILEKSDLVTDTQNRQYLDGLYASTKIVKYWDGGSTWAREHVWPNSKLGIERVGNSDKNQGTDIHNLRAINPSINSSRSNRFFVNGTSNTYHTVGSDGYYPGIEYIGDVARILFYMAVRYPEILTLVETNINDGENYKASGAKFGVLSVLLQWHELDPVSNFEINRNNVIYSYQGNRNPFIDNPSFAIKYFN